MSDTRIPARPLRSPSTSPSTTTSTVAPSAAGSAAIEAPPRPDRIEARSPAGGAHVAVENAGAPGSAVVSGVHDLSVATPAELEEAQATLARLAGSGDLDVAHVAAEAQGALLQVERQAKVDVPIRAKIATARIDRMPKEVPGVLREKQGALTFYPADESLLPFAVDKAQAAHLPKDVLVIARAQQKTVQIDVDNRQLPAQLYALQAAPAASMADKTFIGQVDLIDGQPFLRDLFDKNGKHAPLPPRDAHGKAWVAGTVLEVAAVSGAFVFGATRAEGKSALSRVWGIAADVGLPGAHSPEAMLEAQAIEADPRILGQGFRDLRAKPFFAIDNPGSRDIDQAMHIEKDPATGDTIVSYAIADPSAVIKPGSALWEEGMQRGASSYLPGFSIPMFPDAISSGVVSLNAHTDRRALVTQLRLGADGVVKSREMFRAVIHSQAQLTYEGVSAYLERGTPIAADEHRQAVPRAVLDQLALFDATGGVRARLSVERGVVQPERGEWIVALRGERFAVEHKDSDHASQRNAEISIMANVAGAEAFGDHGIPGVTVPGIYKVHPHAPPHRMTALRNQLKEIVRLHHLPAAWQWKGSEELAAYVDRLKALPQNDAQRAVSASLQRHAAMVHGASEFSAAPGAHAGLQLELYGRFTAPMREMVGVVSQAIVVALEDLKRIVASSSVALSPADNQFLWEHLLLGALVDPKKLGAPRQNGIANVNALAASDAAGIQRSLPKVLQALKKAPPVDDRERGLWQQTIDRAVASGNKAKATQRNVENAGLRALFDDLFASDLGGLQRGDPHKPPPVRDAFVTLVTPEKVYLQLKDPDVEIKLSASDLKHSEGERFTLGRAGASLVSDVNANRPGGRVYSGQAVKVQATYHDGERLHFGIVG